MPNLITTKHPRGAIAILILMGVTVFSLMVLTSVSTLASHAFTITLDEAATEKTFYAAEAGLNEGLYRLIKNPTPQNFNLDFNGVTVAVSIGSNPGNPYQRLVTSRAQDASGKVRELEIVANTASFAGGFDFAVQTGGGLYMDNNSAVIGNVYSNGSVKGSSQAVVQGNLTIAGAAQLDQGSAVQTSELVFGQAPQYDTAQSFVAGSSGTLSRVSVRIKKVGSPNLASQWWRITADDNGKPAITPTDGLAKGTFNDAGVSPIGDNLAWVNINIPTPLAVSAGTKYWLVLDVTNNATNYFVWGKSDTDAYAPGKGVHSSADWDNTGVVWSDIGANDDDFAFQTWLGEPYNRLENVTVWGTARATRITGTGGSSYARVCGDAYYDTILASSLNFLNNPNTQNCPAPLTPGTGYPGTPDANPIPLPLTDQIINDWKDEITNSGNPVLTPDPASCPTSKPSGFYCVQNSGSLGTQKIEGDFYVGNGATLTLTGNLWVTGNVILDNNGTIRLDPSLGADSGVIIADGIMDVSNNYVLQGSGHEHSFLLMVSTNTSQNPAAPAIYASNNTNSIVFSSPWGVLKVKNNGGLNATASYSVYLEPNSTVTYNPNLAYFTIPSGSEQPVGTALGTWREK